ncbi:MAG: hypothetical protein GF416_04765 [Candidatus Altiarchaeales archaeon]|nr:hypothetical protein [Candidatus Altiarchaeales archaeon]MBD3416432.1 hypothetical protein [Candidatus Altiarchaeales archaeon]
MRPVRSCGTEYKSGLKCTDTDLGQHFYFPGTTTGKRYSASTSVDTETDSCEGEFILNEYYYVGDTRYITQYRCPNGCEDGACKSGL